MFSGWTMRLPTTRCGWVGTPGTPLTACQPTTATSSPRWTATTTRPPSAVPAHLPMGVAGGSTGGHLSKFDPFDTFLPLSAASSPTWTASTSWWGRTTATTGGSSGSSGWATTPSSPPWWWSAPRRSPTPHPPYQQFQLRIPSSQPGGWIGTPPWTRVVIIRRRRRGAESGKRILT